MFQRYFDAGLAQASYLLACDRTREAVVIDPRRDVDIYVAAAAQSNLKIVAAIETHIHADFLSGARELAAVGVTTLAGPGASLRFPAREVTHNEDMTIGDLALRFLHTPGHTPEHISVLARQPGEATRVFTGDTLFVGAVGRPDLLGEALMRRLAGQLCDSLFDTLLALDDGWRSIRATGPDRCAEPALAANHIRRLAASVDPTRCSHTPIVTSSSPQSSATCRRRRRIFHG